MTEGDCCNCRPTVAIAASDDTELGAWRAPLDSELSYSQVDAVVRRALDLDTSPGSLKNTVATTDWVVIKPNIVTSRSHRRSSYWYQGRPHPAQETDLRVVKSLIGYLIEKCRPRRITIAEGGAEWRKTGERGTDPAQTEDGWTVTRPEFGHLSYVAIVKAYNEMHPGLVDIVDLNYDSIRFLPVPDPCGSGIGALQRVGETERPVEGFGRGAYVPGTGTPRTGYYIPETVLACDKLISVPAMKTHTLCGTTLAMKNYIGILPNHPSGVVRKSDIHHGDIQKGFVDLFAYHPADYSLIEGFWSTEGNGPQWGDDIRHNVVVASADAVAADAVASAIMGFTPSDLDYLHYGKAKGFGTFHLHEMSLVGTPWQRVRRKFTRAAGRKGIAFATRGNRTWLVRAAVDEKWRRLESGERYIDLAGRFSQASAAYAMVYVDCRHAQRAELWASADGKMRVELNGATVLDKETAGGHRFAECQVGVALKEGVNRLLVYVERSEKGFGFTALLCNHYGDGLYDVEYRLEEAA